jgi:hypothetical protein
VAGIERLSRAWVSVGDEIVEIPWSSRFELLERLRPLNSGSDLVRRFEAVGATSPAELDASSASLLKDVLARWVDESGPGDLPAGIFDLYDSLAGEGPGRPTSFPDAARLPG